MSPKTLFKYFLFWHIAIIVAVTVAGNIIPLRQSDTYLGASITGYLLNPLLNFRSNYDGVHYILIATHGYNYGQQAFFPFYPHLIRFFHSYLDDPILSGVLISSLSFFLGLHFLRRLILLDYSPAVAKWTIIALLFFPTSFFFTAVYTEGLFFLLVVSAFYFARTGRPWLACLIAAFASYTRLIGIFLLPALLLEFLSQNRSRPFSSQLKSLIPLLLIPVGLFVYMQYLDRTTGDPLIFYRLQPAFHQQRSTQIILPYQVFWRYIKMVATVTPRDFSYLTLWLEFVTGLVFFVLSAVSIFRQRLSYAVFNLFAFMLPTLTGIFTSLPRYVLICFAVFIIIGENLAAYPVLRRVILLVFGLFWVVFLSLFARGYWVA